MKDYLFREQCNENITISSKRGKDIENQIEEDSGYSALVWNEDGTFGLAASPIKKNNLLFLANQNAGMIKRHGNCNTEILYEFCIRDKVRFDLKRINSDYKMLKDFFFQVKTQFEKNNNFDYEVILNSESIIKKFNSSYTCMQNAGFYRNYLYLTLYKGDKFYNQKRVVQKLNLSDNMEEWGYAIEDTIEKMSECLGKKIKSVNVPPGKHIAVLSGKVVSVIIHELIGHSFEADAIYNMALLKEQFTNVNNSMINIVDYANLYNDNETPVPIYFDDELIKSVDTVLVKNGRCSDILSDVYNSQRLETKPCGCARAFKYNDEPLVRMRNTVLLSGNAKIKEMISSVEDGYYFENTGGGIAVRQGAYRIIVTEGYEIKKGLICQMIDEIEISGTISEFLNSIDMLGERLEWNSAGYCIKKQKIPVSMAAPAVRCQVTIL